MTSIEPIYMVYLEGKSTPAYIHETIESAEDEARRLVKAYGLPAYVLTSIKRITIPSPFVVEDARPYDDLPF